MAPSEQNSLSGYCKVSSRLPDIVLYNAQSSLRGFSRKDALHVPLTSTCWVHSNVYALGDIHCIRNLTAVDPFHSTSFAVHTYHHLTSVSVEIPLATCTGNSSSIGKEPVPYGTLPHFTSIRRSATSSLGSYAEQGIITFTNVFQGHIAVVLVWCTSEY